MFYTSKNCKITINNQTINADNATIGTDYNLNPVYLQDKRHTNKYVLTDGVNGNLKISYYLTGADYLKQFINIENQVLSGNFGGLYFQSGYLSKFSFRCEPNRPIIADTNIVFFEQLNGTFAPQSVAPNLQNVLNFSDATITNTAGFTTENITNITSLNYDYSADIKPVYYLNATTGLNSLSFNRIYFGHKQIESQITCDNISGNLSTQGENIGLTITLNSPLILNLVESFNISGQVFKKEITNRVNDFVKNTISIRQNITENAPVISSFYPWSGNPGGSVILYGTGFTNTVDVIFNDDKTRDFNVINDNLLRVNIPQNAMSGNLLIDTFGGQGTSLSGFLVNYLPITVNSFTPVTGISGQTIMISGSNFYRITHIKFGNSGLSPIVSSNFQRVGPNIIFATIPYDAPTGYLTVIASGRLTTGFSSYGFIPNPVITGFYPQTGISGQTINISGFGFNSISAVMFNNVPSTNFTIIDTHEIHANIPSGNTRGFITITGLSGVTTTTITTFEPSIVLTGIYPSSGHIGDAVVISGYIFFTGLLYPFSGLTTPMNILPGSYAVNINGGITGFIPTNFNTLTGQIPYDSQIGVGFVNLYNNDGVSTYDSNITFNVRNLPPVITSLMPNFSYQKAPYPLLSGILETSIIGANLFNINNVLITGYVSGTASGSGMNVGTQYLSSDVLGNKVLVSGFSITGFLTGEYFLSANFLEGTAYYTGVSPYGQLFGGVQDSGFYLYSLKNL